MNVRNSADINAVFGFLFSNWFIPLFVLIGLFMLLVVIFKGFRRGYKLLVFGLILAAAAFIAWLVLKFVTWNKLEIICFLIAWGPTILFVFIVLTATLVNAKRGLRKSLILLLHSAVAGAVCLALYFVCVKVKAVDASTLSFLNLFMGENGLQNALGVSADSDTLRGVLTEFIPTLVSSGSEFDILLSENAAYIYTLVDTAYRVVFATVCYLLYFILVFLLYLIYHIAYSERKYKRVKTVRFENNQTDKPYRKRHISGGVVGLARGICVGLLTLSFAGSALFIVAGTGEGKLEDYDFGNDEANFYYDVFRSIESYGTQGIYKILNSLTDADDTPYYLFAADLIFSGELYDEELGIDTDISLREELGAFTGFARDTFALLMKYGEEELSALVGGGVTDGSFDSIIGVMTKPQFRDEFDDLINEFDSKTYIINLSMSLVNSIVANVDDMSFADVSAENKELLKIIFKKGYLSPVIPDERDYMLAHGTRQAEGNDVRPYLHMAHVLNKNDARLCLNFALSYISEDTQEEDTLALTKRVLPALTELSILGESRREQVNAVFGRLYCWLENEYLTAEGEDGATYGEVKDISWVEEIFSLIDVTQNLIELYSNISEEEAEPLDTILAIFDETDANYAQNIALYDDICTAVASSRALGVALSTSFAHWYLTEAFSAVSPNLYVPRGITYENSYYANGEVQSYGETYMLLHGLRFLGGNAGLLDTLFNFDGSSDISDVMQTFSEVIQIKDGNGFTISDYLTRSSLLHSILSAVLLDSQDDTLYIPSASLERDGSGNPVYLINRRELKQLLDNTRIFVDFVMPFVDGDYLDTLDGFIESESFNTILDENRIFEGTVANLLIIKLTNNSVVITPKELSASPDGWITVDGYAGELRKLVNAIKIIGLPLTGLMQDSYASSEIYDKMLSLDGGGLNEIFLSSVMHYTVSNYVLNGASEMEGLSLIIPAVARQSLKDDAIKSVIKKTELVTLFSQLSELGVNDETDYTGVLVRLSRRKDVLSNSKIISASLVYSLANDGDLCSLLSVPQSFIDAGGRSELEYFDTTNPWSTEIYALLDALDETLNLSAAPDNYEITEEVFNDALDDLIKSLNDKAKTNPQSTRLKVCHASVIMRNNMTVELDGVFLDGEIVEESVIRQAKLDGYYRLSELQSLSYALEIFDLDVFELESEELTSSVKGEIFTLNEPLEKFGGRTTLNVVYPSVIISSMISDELDKALTEDVVEASVLRQIKRGGTVYGEEEISRFVDALNELEMQSLDEISEYDFSDVSYFSGNSSLYGGQTKLEVIYRSDIAGGVITKAVKAKTEDGELLCDHPKAYRSDVKIYKQSEIQSIIEVLDGAKIDGYKLDVSRVADYIYNERGETKSYLMTAKASELLKNNNALIVPLSCVDGSGTIYPQEIRAVIDVFLAYGGDYENTEIEEWDAEILLPEGEIRDTLYSSGILRARITYQIAHDMQSVWVTQENVTVETSVRGNLVCVLAEEELRRLADALDICGEGGVFAIPEFTVEAIGGYDETTLEVLFLSDIIRFSICDTLTADELVRAYMTDGGMLYTQNAFNIVTRTQGNKKVASAGDIVSALEEIKNS